MPRSPFGVRLPLASLGLTVAALGLLATPVLAQTPKEPDPIAQVQLKAGPRRLTLEEAKQLAVGNNKALALGRLNVDEKGHAANAARKDYFPKVLGSASYFHFDSDLGQVLTVQRGRLGVLPPGSRIVNATVLNQDSSLSTVFLAQPITKLIAVYAAVKIARADEQAAQAQLDKGTRDVLSGVAQAYYGLVGAKRIQAALELQIGLLEQVLAVKPVPALRVALLEAKQGLIDVRSQVKELTDLLNDLVGLPPDTCLDLVDPLPAELPVRCGEDAAQLALSASPEVREAAQQIAKAEAALKVAYMDYLPDVNVIGGYANQTTADYIQPNIGYVGLTGSYTFWDWGKRKDVKRQRQTLIALANQNLDVVSDKVQAEARKAFVGYEKARETLALAREMVQAREAAEADVKGAALAQAKGETAKAQLEYVKAEIAFRVAHAQLAALLGKD